MASPSQSPPANLEDRPRVLRLHHLKLAVGRLDVSLVWYERVLGARRLPALDHSRDDGTRYAVICEMTEWSGIFVELRESPMQAGRSRGWDCFTLLARSREDLISWINWLDQWGTSHSPMLIGPRGWILVFEDPDGRRFRMYTQEQHDGTLQVSEDSEWLPDP